MPYLITTEGMDELVSKLERAEERAKGVAARALYRGAGVVADAISSGARGIATSPFKYAKGGNKRKPSPEEKAALTAAGAAGIAKFDKNGLAVNTAVGYNRSGYVQVNWNHMSRNANSNYKIKGGSAIWSKKAYLKKDAVTGHAVEDRKSGLSNAKPVAVIANAINSGTSFMEKQPFIRKAITKSKGQALSVMEATIDELVGQLLE